MEECEAGTYVSRLQLVYAVADKHTQTVRGHPEVKM